MRESESDLYGQQQMGEGTAWDGLKSVEFADTRNKKEYSDEEVRHLWEEKAEEITRNTDRKEGESFEEFGKRVNDMIPTLDEFRDGMAMPQVVMKPTEEPVAAEKSEEPVAAEESAEPEVAEEPAADKAPEEPASAENLYSPDAVLHGKLVAALNRKEFADYLGDIDLNSLNDKDEKGNYIHSNQELILAVRKVRTAYQQGLREKFAARAKSNEKPVFKPATVAHEAPEADAPTASEDSAEPEVAEEPAVVEGGAEPEVATKAETPDEKERREKEQREKRIYWLWSPELAPFIKPAGVKLGELSKMTNEQVTVAFETVKHLYDKAKEEKTKEFIRRFTARPEDNTYTPEEPKVDIEDNVTIDKDNLDDSVEAFVENEAAKDKKAKYEEEEKAKYEAQDDLESIKKRIASLQEQLKKLEGWEKRRQTYKEIAMLLKQQSELQKNLTPSEKEDNVA